MLAYRRRLPHIQPDDGWFFVTWRLFGSLPGGVDRVRHPSAGHAFMAADRDLARNRSGPLWLESPRIADVVVSAIQSGESEKHFYELRAWVVMPNHVHLLIRPKRDLPIITRWLKGTSARSANLLLGRTGEPFWRDESYDHWLRDGSELEKVVRYIEENPVAAGLVGSADEWLWSSAFEGRLKPAPQCGPSNVGQA
jgi:putative transposase